MDNRRYLECAVVGRVCYLAGPISGFPAWRLRFAVAERVLWGMGALAVLSPRALPDGLTYDQYMRICIPMVDAAQAVVLLPRWQGSPGARAEFRYASAVMKLVFFWEEQKHELASG